MNDAWRPAFPPPPPPTSPPFWKSGGGIALIIVLGVLLIPALCIFGCLGMGIIGAATNDPTTPPSDPAPVVTTFASPAPSPSTVPGATAVAAVPSVAAPKATEPASVFYANCAAAKAAGAAPLRRGEPGYRSALDRDGDGTACDK